MKNNSLIFICSNCDAQFTKWTGRCLECGKWGTIEKSTAGSDREKNQKSEENEYPAVKTNTLKEIEGKNVARIKTGIEELDRVLGGGLVPGSLVLLGGEPGIGKSTLAAQIASIIPNTIYISGEESVEQIKLRAERLKIKSDTLRIGNATGVESIIATIRACHCEERSDEAISSPTIPNSGIASSPSQAPRNDNRIAVIDSIQTIHSDEVEGEAGGVSQVRACTVKLMETAKSSGTIIILIGQVTKEGNVAGPKTLEHLVDTVLYLEGDRFHQFRVLRAAKNRFGSTDEVGIFSMDENGLVEVKNPSAAMLAGRPENVPGSAVTCLMEGTRPLLMEIQALVTKTAFGFPQRKVSGFDTNRLQMLSAVLSKRAGLPLDTYDIFLNVIGGLTAEEPAADLAVVLAIASATKNKEIPKNLAAFGEVGLSGEVRAVPQIKKRLEEIKKMGFDFAVVPHHPDLPKIPGLKIASIKNVQEVVEKIIK
ncbi:MAG: DNA repair protein RadA [bacterium]